MRFLYNASFPHFVFFSCDAQICGLLVSPCRFLMKLTQLEGYEATPLLAVVIVVESTDMLFAVDSIPVSTKCISNLKYNYNVYYI